MYDLCLGLMRVYLQRYCMIMHHATQRRSYELYVALLQRLPANDVVNNQH